LCDHKQLFLPSSMPDAIDETKEKSLFKSPFFTLYGSQQCDIIPTFVLYQ
jgi:hypothetical protein